MPLSRLENFLVNTDGNILYVNPSDLDATDSFDNKGNSLTRPFVTIQRALIESARFAYQSGPNNDRFDKTTILLYPGTHYIDNRPGYYVKNNGGVAQYYDVNQTVVSSPDIELTNSSNFDLISSSNVLYKFNSVEGGVIVPKGTSIVGLDLRKTKVKPLYVPDPENNSVERSAIFRVTGGCYFWQFSVFDADRAVYYNYNYAEQASPTYSHNKLTVFEYADGVNLKTLTGTSDLQMYYYKLMNAYGDDTGNREIIDYPTSNDFEPNSPEFKIVGDLTSGDTRILELNSSATVASVTTEFAHGLSVDDSIRIAGVGSALYNGSFKVVGVTSERKFTYQLPSAAIDTSVTISMDERVIIEPDGVNGASPYIFNCSLRSAFGMCGLHADGSKATGFKSMVVAQYTGIGLQKDSNAFVIYNESTGLYDTNSTTSLDKRPLYINQEAIYKPAYENYHIKASNDAFIQDVSVFAIGFAQHFLAEDGADQSITNSNSNFGSKSLISKGFRKESFPRDDTGYVTHIIPPKDFQEDASNVLWRSLDVGLTTSYTGVGQTSRLYLLGETDINNPPSNVTNGYRVGSNINEKLYVTVNINAVDYTYSSPILMQVPTGEGPTAQKTFTVTQTLGVNNISSNILTLNAPHNFYNGESVRVFSDNAIVPDGLENGALYYVITTGLGANQIKLAKTINNVNDTSPSPVIIKNTNGGILSIVSRVSDKLSGDPGHPIQFDSTNKNWYIIGSGTTATNQIYQGFKNNSTTIAANNSSTFIQRKSENRDLTDRIYKLRYVIPKDYTDAKIPAKNYVLQESSTVKEDSTITTINSNRNSHVIAGISTVGSTVTVTSERPHRLSVSDRVRIGKVVSSTNSTAADNAGFNGYFVVTSVPSSKTFTFTNTYNGGTFVNNVSTRGDNLPVFSRNEYDTTYTIENVETIQEYSSGLQDGIYYLTCLIGNISPSATEFASQKFKQNITDLYPVVDKDNLVTDPLQSLTGASNKLIGKVIVNNPQNSITKESIINYLKDNRIGLAVTNAVSISSGLSTVFTSTDHNLNTITGLSILLPGSGYGSGISSTLYNVSLVGVGITGNGATANVTVSAAGTITAVSIVDGGSAYGVGNTMSVGSGGGSVTVSSINNNVGDVVQIIGVGTTGNRNNGGYNGLYKISAINSSKSVTYNVGSNPGIYTTSSGILYVVDKSLPVSTIAGVSNATTAGIVTITTSRAHGLSVGNKIKVTGVTGTASTIFNSDFFVKEKVSLTAFTILAPIGVGTAAGSAEVYKYGITSYGEDTSLQSEKISGSLVSMNVGYTTTTSNTTTNTSSTLSLTSTIGFTAGNFIQIDNEILRIISLSTINSTDASVLRGVLGTKSAPHDSGSIVRKISVIPSETRRFTSIRASGHTFEYLGYGPGNYSTALPQRQNRVITDEEERLAVSKEEKGGVVFFSGMNDRGDFFTGERLTAKETFIGETPSDSTATYDDVYIRNTLRVGGGSNRLLPSEFRGPVNFTNKITSTASQGIEAIKLQLKGNSIQDPSFQIGPDSNPSLIVNELNQYVGIKTAIPNFELDVNGRIRANGFENFQLTDLPTTDEGTFASNRVIKVKDDGSGYELVDYDDLLKYKLRRFKISNDGTVYTGIGSTVSNTLQISGISTSNFYVGERVKVFGVDISGSATVEPPDIASMSASPVGGLSPTIVGITSGYLSENPDLSITQITTTGIAVGDIVTGTTVLPGTFVTGIGTSTISVNQGITAGIGTIDFTFTRYSHTYRYWVAQYHLRNGKVGVSSQISPFGGFTMSYIDNFNDTDNISINLKRSDTNHGLLVYRQIGVSTNINNAKLIGILGPKELGSNISNITWIDYGTFDQTEWSGKGTVSEYGSDQIHFPNIATTGQKRGWKIDEIVSIGSSTIRLSGQYTRNSDNQVKVVHDNTAGLSSAIDQVIADKQYSLDLPSGTYLTNKLIIPSGFTLKGNGKNTVIKTQYFATDETDGPVGVGISLSLDGNIVGVGTTTASDISIYDLTIDGNSGNNILFNGELHNYIMYFDNITSSVFKDIEIRNSPGHGLYLNNSSRISVDNCSFVDGSISDRYPFSPLNTQDSNTLRINDCLFENYPGPVDLSVSSVVATGGNIIRNCGTGLRIYASSEIITTNNIILGPADEYISSPDIYDSDFNSINLTIDRGVTFSGPVLQYLENGLPKDISSTKVSIVSAGIGTIVGQGTTNETLDTRFLNFNIITPDSGEYSRANGYIQLGLTSIQTVGLGLSSALGYNIIAQEYNTIPVGFTTYIGIGTGTFNTIGAGSTQYTITLSDPNQFPGISAGDVIKLINHSVSPDLSSYTLTVAEKINAGAADKRLRLTGFTTTSITNGSQTGYISIRNTFTIAKGRVGVI
jgi:hypothetical protein